MPAGSRELSREKAARIVDAMRASVATRGTAGSTFDHVAREAGVSRGLLHYYFGTKERLLVEVVRRDCDLRMAALDAALSGARTADDVIDALVRQLEDAIRTHPEFFRVLFELFALARHNEEVAVAFEELLRRTREQVAEALRAKVQQGVLDLQASPEAVADVLFSLADGLALRILGEPDVDHGPTIAAAVTCARALLS